MNPFRDDGGSHWYSQTGEPRYQTPIATGARKGEMRSTTLRDARKENLLPSITTVLKAYPKAALDAWIIEQAVLARHNYAPPDEETAAPLEAMNEATEAQKIYFGHVKTLANHKRDEAAARGNAEPELGSSDTRGGQPGCPQADDDEIKRARHGTTVVAVIVRLDVGGGGDPTRGALSAMIEAC